ILRFENDWLGQRVAARFTHIGAQPRHYGSDVLGGVGRAGKRRRGREPGRAKQQAATSQVTAVRESTHHLQAAPYPAAALRTRSPSAPAANIWISARLIAAWRVGEAIFAPNRSVT